MLKFLTGQGQQKRNMASPGIISSGSASWLAWFVVCALVSAALVPNLTLWPRITQDEVQIVELGRVFLDPGTDWSVGWLVHESTAKTTGSFLGVVTQELAYRLSSPSNFGNRLWAFLGALLSATMVLGWLRSRATPKCLALALASIFLLDPIFNESYRQGRIDGWAFSVCIAACWLLSASMYGRKLKDHLEWRLVLAGALSGLAYFIWPTTLALMPLVLLEFLYVLRALWNQQADHRFSRVAKALLLFAAGGLLVVVICLVPVLLQWESQVLSFRQGIRIQQVASQFQKSIIDIYLLYDPMILAGLLVSLTIRREAGLLIAMFIALVLMYQTMIYKARILYLLPYLIAIFAGACAALTTREFGPYRKLALYSAVSLLLAWSAAVSLVKRPLLAYYQEEARSPEQIQAVLSELIGEGPHRVLTSQMSVYFAARALGWKSFKVFGRYYKNSEDFYAFLEDIDYVILSEKYFWANETSPQTLELAGFELFSTVTFIKPESQQFSIAGIKLLAPDQIYEDILVYRKGPVESRHGPAEENTSRRVQSPESSLD